MQREEIRMGTKKGAVPSPNGKQHTKKKTRSYYITLGKEIQEWTNFDFNHEQIMLLVERLQKRR